MDSNEMIEKMATSCIVLNDILRDPGEYRDLRNEYQRLEEDGKMHKMIDLYNLCEEFSK